MIIWVCITSSSLILRRRRANQTIGHVCQFSFPFSLCSSNTANLFALFFCLSLLISTPRGLSLSAHRHNSGTGHTTETKNDRKFYRKYIEHADWRKHLITHLTFPPLFTAAHIISTRTFWKHGCHPACGSFGWDGWTRSLRNKDGGVSNSRYDTHVIVK